jgi:hypothetical protein
LFAHGPARSRIGQDEASADRAVPGIHLVQVGIDLDVFGIYLAQVGIDIDVSGIDIAEDGIDINAFGIDIALVGIDIDVLGISLLDSGRRLARRDGDPALPDPPPRLRLLALPFPRAHLAARGEALEQPRRRARDLVDGAREGLEIRLRRLYRAAHLANELQRGGADLLFGRGRFEVVKDADVAAHGDGLLVDQDGSCTHSTGTPPYGGAT